MTDHPTTGKPTTDQIWKCCGDLVGRLESRLGEVVEGDVFTLTANDMLTTLPTISGVEISFGAIGHEKTLAVAGRPPGDQVNVLVRAPVTEQAALQIRVAMGVGLAMGVGEGGEPAGPEHPNHLAIKETTGAICGLLVGAIARLRLGEIEDELDTVTTLAKNLQNAADPSDRFFRIAVELANVFQVDRLSLLRRSALGYRLVASSVQSQFDPRAERVVDSEAFAQKLAKRVDAGPTAWSWDCSEAASTGFDEAAEFLRRGESVAGVATTFADQAILAIGERFQQSESIRPTDRGTNRLPALTRLIFDDAIAESIRGRKRPLSEQIFEAAVKYLKPWRLGIAACIVAFLMFFPKTIYVESMGRVVPVKHHVVYSPVDGQIESLDCDAGQRVSVGQVLCTFSSHELELNLTRLRGEALTVQEQLEIAATRRGSDLATEISSDRRVLEVRLAELKKQLDVLTLRQGRLVVRSPIAGIVSLVTPDDRGAFFAPRPVQVGQPLIRVVDPDDGYRVELEVPDQQVGYVAASMEREDRPPVLCEFRIRSEPETLRSGEVIQMAQTATLDRLGRVVIAVTVQPDNVEQAFTTDSGVVGWIDCGKASTGFVMCRKVIEQLRLWGVL